MSQDRKEAIRNTYNRFSEYVSEISPDIELVPIKWCQTTITHLLIPCTGNVDSDQMKEIKRFPCEIAVVAHHSNDRETCQFQVPFMVANEDYVTKSRSCCTLGVRLVIYIIVTLILVSYVLRWLSS